MDDGGVGGLGIDGCIDFRRVWRVSIRGGGHGRGGKSVKLVSVLENSCRNHVEN